MSTEATPSRPLRRSDFVISPFLERSDLKAGWQLATTLIPIAGLWILLANTTLSTITIGIKAIVIIPSICLLVLLSSRTFSLMHDCGHGSLFKSQWLNKLTGFLLGVLNAIPQHPWSRGHAYHHKHNGNWELYRGPSALITVDEYQNLSSFNKSIYRISRHPLMLFPGGFFYLIIKPRLTLGLGLIEFFKYISLESTRFLIKKGAQKDFSFTKKTKEFKSGFWYTSGELLDLIGNNILVITSWILMCQWLGPKIFWIYYSIIMTISAAIFICVFFIQHNYENSYAHGTKGWNYLKGAVDGSSNLDVPKWMNWFFADISFHSIHHLCERIPNYNLRQCHNANKELLKQAKILKISEIPSCFKYILWNANLQELTTIEKAAKS